MPIMDGSQYNLIEIQTLKNIYAQKDLELSAAAQVTASAGMSAMGTTAPVSSRQTSLI